MLRDLEKTEENLAKFRQLTACRGEKPLKVFPTRSHNVLIWSEIKTAKPAEDLERSETVCEGFCNGSMMQAANYAISSGWARQTFVKVLVSSFDRLSLVFSKSATQLFKKNLNSKVFLAHVISSVYCSMKRTTICSISFTRIWELISMKMK